MTHPEASDTTTVEGALTRRRALSLAAWAAPVVAIAVAAPALAAGSNEPTVALANGDVSPDGGATRFEGVPVGDPEAQVPLAFNVTDPGGAPMPSGALTAFLTGATGIASWQEPSGDGQTIGDVTDGSCVLPLAAEGYGTFSVTVSMNGRTWVFSVTFAA